MTDVEIIKSEILQGLSQVDSSFYFTYFESLYDKETRKLKVFWKAKNADDDEVSGVNDYA